MLPVYNRHGRVWRKCWYFLIFLGAAAKHNLFIPISLLLFINHTSTMTIMELLVLGLKLHLHLHLCESLGAIEWPMFFGFIKKCFIWRNDSNGQAIY